MCDEKKGSNPSPITRHTSPITRHASLPWRILRFPEVNSTQDVAKGLREAWLVVVAGRQRRGRGRRGSVWHSPEGGLWLSAVFPPPAPAHIQVARAVADAIRDALGVPVEVDPPNDLMLHGKKLGGILIETRFQGESEGMVIVGIGINANNPIPEELRGTAISLREATGEDVDLEKLLEIVLRGLEYLLRRRECRE